MPAPAPVHPPFRPERTYYTVFSRDSSDSAVIRFAETTESCTCRVIPKSLSEVEKMGLILSVTGRGAVPRQAPLSSS